MLFDAQNLLTWKENKEKINLIHCLILRKKYTQPYEKKMSSLEISVSIEVVCLPTARRGCHLY